MVDARHGFGKSSCWPRRLLGGLLALSAVGWPVAAGAVTAPLAITTTTLGSAEVGGTYSLHLQASGGSPPYSWTTSASLPAGLSLSNGVLSGRPTTAGSTVLTFLLVDAAGATQSAALELDTAPGPAITTSSAPDPVLGQPYSFNLGVAQGMPPFTWSVASGPLPVGLVLNSSGSLTGLPATTGTSTATIAVTDGLGARATAPFSVTVDASPLPRAAYLLSSKSAAVSAYASPGVTVPQTGQESLSGIVAITTDAAMDRYFLVDAAGRVTASPGARSLGSVGPKHRKGKVVAIAANAAGSGYWIATSTGHVYGFGALASLGSVAPRRLHGHIVGLAANAAGTGYWLVSSTGRIYAFGTADVLPRQGRVRPANIVGIAADPVASGFWLVDRAGRVFTYGNALPAGSLPASAHLRSVLGIAAAPDGAGYWLVLRNGVVEGLGSAHLLAGVEVGASGGAVGIASAS